MVQGLETLPFHYCSSPVIHAAFVQYGGKKEEKNNETKKWLFTASGESRLSMVIVRKKSVYQGNIPEFSPDGINLIFKLLPLQMML